MPRRLNLYPDIICKDWWNATNFPRQLSNQKFASVLVNADLSDSDAHVHKGFKIRPRMPASVKASGTSEVKIDEKGFQISLDVDEFEWEELSVESTGRYIEVCGKHEEKRDQHGLVSREFSRRYMVPYNCNIEAVASSFTVDGKLVIKVPIGDKTEKKETSDPVEIQLVAKIPKTEILHSTMQLLLVDKAVERSTSSDEVNPMM